MRTELQMTSAALLLQNVYTLREVFNREGECVQKISLGSFVATEAGMRFLG